MSNNSNQRAIVPSSGFQVVEVNRDSTQPRQPSNLPDLLRFSIEASQNENVSETNNAVENPTSSRFEFLQNALASMSDHMKEISEALKILQNIDEIGVEGDISSYEEALDNISDYVEHIDVARDFCQMGGFTVIFPLLYCCRGSIRWRAATIFGDCTQNNAFCQQEVLSKIELLPKLLNMADSDPDVTTRTKAFFAVSSIVRNNSVGLSEFMKLDGFSVIMRAMQSNVEKIIIKSSFFLRALCNSNPELKDELVSMGFVEQLIGLIGSQEFCCTTEYILFALDSLIRDHNGALLECKRLGFDLRIYLTDIIERNKDDEGFSEAVDCAREILNCLVPEEVSEK